MNLLKCILTANDCYKANQTITPKGVMVHSTGANNKNLKRYVQPLESDANYNELITKLGKNTNNNDWNKSGTGACAHGFIGVLADGSVATVQTLPWNWRGWHCGTGTSGNSANNTHISFEICEDGLTDATYFNKVYQEAVELVAMLCKEYGFDPMADGVVICHSEGYTRGIASNHADVMHWFPKFGKSMDNFRADVKSLMNEGKEDDVTVEGNTYVVQSGDSWWGIATKVFGEGQGSRYPELQALNPDITTLHPGDVIVIKAEEETKDETTTNIEEASSWAQEAWVKAYNKGIMDGTNPQGTVTREMLAVVLDALGLLD